MDLLYDGARDAYQPFMKVALYGTGKELKPKMQNSLDRYLPKFEKVIKSRIYSVYYLPSKRDYLITDRWENEG